MNSLFEVIAPGLPSTYYAGGNGAGGTSIVFSASASAVILKANSRMDLTDSGGTVNAARIRTSA